MPQTLVTRNLQWFLVKSLFSNSLLLTRCELLRQVRRRLPSLYFLKVLLFFLRFYLRRLLISTSILHFLWEIFVVSFFASFYILFNDYIYTYALYHLNTILFGYFWHPHHHTIAIMPPINMAFFIFFYRFHEKLQSVL